VVALEEEVVDLIISLGIQEEEALEVEDIDDS